jgi:uncharacterized coiled-coil protein SlyX
MNVPLKTLTACVAVLLFAAAPIAGEPRPQQPTTAEDLTREMASLRAAVEELSGLMEAMLEQQQAALDQQAMELALRRLAMAREELEPIKAQLRKTEEDRLLALEDQRLLEAELDRVNDQLADAVSEGDEEMVQRLRGMPEQISVPLQRSGDRIWQLDQRIIELENELAEKEEALAELSQAIDQWLGIR